MHIFDRLKEREPLQSDDQLLQRFGDQQDQAAFGLIVKRYGALVQRVCRGVGLRDHDADDVFQATFLVVAQKARLLRRKNSLGAFVHGTAYRFALDGQRFSRRRRRHEKAAAKPESSSEKAGPEAEVSLREALSAVDGELNSMPEKYRVPLILHLLEGKILEEVSRQLSIPLRTICRRIKDGQEMLRRRLARRGIQASIMLFPLLIVTRADAAIAPALAAATAKSAALFVQGSAPASAVTLMASSAVSAISKLTGPAKVAATIKFWMSKTAVVAVIGVACAGVWYETRPNSRPANGFGSSPTALPAPLPTGPIVVRGRILDEEGLPVPQAQVTLLASRGLRGEHGQHDDVLLQVQAGADGAFALEVPQDFPFWARGRDEAKLLASAPGRALGATAVSLRAVPVSANIRLRSSEKVNGQVVDNENRPVAGVAIHVVGLGPVGREVIQGSDDPRPDSLTGWPQPVITDHEGRFAFAGLDPRQGVRLEVRDERFARQLTVVAPSDQQAAQPQPGLPTEDITIKLAPLQLLVGQVLAADTGKPLPYARLSMVPSETRDGLRPELRLHVDARADEGGRFRMQPLPGGKFTLFACGQDHDPYVTMEQDLTWPQNKSHTELTLLLLRGIPVRGQVVEADTGLPVYGARVDYAANLTTQDLSPNPRQPRLSGGRTTYTTQDGRFFIPVLPGRGYLRVSSVRDTEAYQLCGSEQDGPDGLTPTLAMQRLDLPAVSPGTEVRLEVRRTRQLSGRVVDNAGQPVLSCSLLTAGEFNYTLYRAERTFRVADGGFLVAQVAADSKYPVALIDVAHKQGLFTTQTGKAQERLPTFRLQPCGSAMGELKTENGRGLVNAPIELAAVLPFVPYGKPVEEIETPWYRNLNRDEPGQTTIGGKFALPALVPGLRYRLYAGTGNWRRLVKEFTVEPGQKLQLGSLIVKY